METVRYSENLKLTKQTNWRHKPNTKIIAERQSFVEFRISLPWRYPRPTHLRSEDTHRFHLYTTILTVVSVVSSATSASLYKTPRLRFPKQCSLHRARFGEVGLVEWAKADEFGPQSFLVTQTGDVDQWRCCVVRIFCLLLVLGYSTADFSSRAAWHDDEMTGGGRWGDEACSVFESSINIRVGKRDGRRDGQNYVTYAGTVCQ